MATQTRATQTRATQTSLHRQGLHRQVYTNKGYTDQTTVYIMRRHDSKTVLGLAQGQVWSAKGRGLTFQNQSDRYAAPLKSFLSQADTKGSNLVLCCSNDGRLQVIG